MPKTHIDYRITSEETLVIKAFAVILMLLHHVLLEHLDYGPVVHGLAGASKVCVALFVFLSGYGMAASFPKKAVKRLDTVKEFFFFLARRFTKFFMNYWVIFLIALPIGVFCFGRSLEMVYGANANLSACFLGDMFGLQSFESYNTAWWFNRIILALWLLFPLFYRIMKNGIVAVCVLLFFFVNPGDILYSFELIAKCLSIYVPLFCIGIFTALHSDFINKILNTFPTHLVLCASVLWMAIFLFLRGVPLIPSFSFFRVDPFATVFFVLSVVSASRVAGIKFSIMRHIGKHSMNMYLTHIFVLMFLLEYWTSEFRSPALLLITVFLFSLLLSIALERAKEKMGFYKLQDRIVSFLSRQMSSANN